MVEFLYTKGLFIVSFRSFNSARPEFLCTAAGKFSMVGGSSSTLTKTLNNYSIRNKNKSLNCFWECINYLPNKMVLNILT